MEVVVEMAMEVVVELVVEVVVEANRNSCCLLQLL